MQRAVTSMMVVVAATAAHAKASTTDTSFTYQGRLDHHGAPADGAFDVVFSLYDAANGGNLVSSNTRCGDGQISVVDGLFTANLDYGTTPFNGQGLWLQIHVRPAVGGCQVCGGGCPYTLLSPRQPITAAPFALYALSGPSATGGSWSSSGPNIFNTNAGNVGIGTSTPARPLEVSGPQSIFRMTTSAHNSGSVIELRNDTATPTLLGAFNFMNDVGSARGQIAYRAEEAMTFRTNQSERMRIDGAGNVGIGTTSPTAKLELRLDPDGTDPGLQVSRKILTTENQLAIDHNSITSYPTGGFFGYPLFLNFHNNNPVVIGYGGGNCGIGGGAAAFPLTRLHVDGGFDADPADPSAGYVLVGAVRRANIVMDNNEIMARNNGAVSTLYINNEGGDVRIGQNGPPSTVFVPSLSVNTSCAIGTAAVPTGVKLAVDGGTDASPGNASGGYVLVGNAQAANIVMDNNEIMARDNGAVSTLYLNADGGDVLVGGYLDIGLEIVESNACNEYSNGSWLELSCPSGKRLIAGGCSSGSAADDLTDSHPKNSTTWRCHKGANCDPPLRAYVICARVK